MGSVLKSKVDDMIGSKLSPNNVLVTNSWKIYKTYAIGKGIEHYRIKSDGKRPLSEVYFKSKM